MKSEQHAALERLIRIAQSDTGQSRRTANFLLAWWNASSCGGFDLTDLWNVDQVIADDMVIVFTAVANENSYPDQNLYGERFEALAASWRPELVTGDAAMAKSTRS